MVKVLTCRVSFKLQISYCHKKSVIFMNHDVLVAWQFLYATITL